MRREVTRGARGGCAVLVVEDDAETRGAYADALRLAGYRVLTAADGREALWQMAAVTRPCVLVLDLHMDGMDGGRLLETLVAQEQLEDFPTVVVTGAERVPAQLPAATVLRKPVALPQLLAAVEALHAGARADAG